MWVELRINSVILKFSLGEQSLAQRKLSCPINQNQPMDPNRPKLKHYDVSDGRKTKHDKHDQQDLEKQEFGKIMGQGKVLVNAY